MFIKIIKGRNQSGSWLPVSAIARVLTYLEARDAFSDKFPIRGSRAEKDFSQQGAILLQHELSTIAV